MTTLQQSKLLRLAAKEGFSRFVKLCGCAEGFTFKGERIKSLGTECALLLDACADESTRTLLLSIQTLIEDAARRSTDIQFIPTG